MNAVDIEFTTGQDPEQAGRFLGEIDFKPSRQTKLPGVEDSTKASAASSKYSSLKDDDLFWDHPRLNMWEISS